MDCDTMVYALAYKGMFGGNPVTIWNTQVDIVVNAYNYMHFMNEYEETSMIINTKDKK